MDDLERNLAAFNDHGFEPIAIRCEGYGVRQFAVAALDGYEIAVTSN